MTLPSENSNEFDKLIKEAGEHYQAPGATPDWDKMNSLLDKHIPKKDGRDRRGFLLLIILFFLSAGIFLYFNNRAGRVVTADKVPTNNTIPGTAYQDQKNNTAKEPATANTKPTAAEPVNVTGSRKNDPVASAGAKTNAITSADNKSDLAASTIKNSHEPGSKMITHSSRFKTRSKGKNQVNTSQGEAGEITSTTGVTKPADTDHTTGKIETPASTTDPVTTAPVNPPLTDPNTAKKDSSTVVPDHLPVSSVDSTLAAKKTSPGKRRHPFEIALLYAPELTTVGFKHIDKPGSGYGVIIGYHLSENLTIQTGVVRSKKNYVADGADFKPEYMAPGNHKLEKVSGYCMMYEIPLAIRSTFLKKKKSSFFYMAGISSYIMQSEFYTYYYSSAYGAYTKDVRFNTQRNYWLSVASAGAGLEREISRSLTFTVAPFFKIPFRGYGEGDLKMSSMGINFFLTYKAK